MTLNQHDLCPDDWEYLGVQLPWLAESWDEDHPETIYRLADSILSPLHAVAPGRDWLGGPLIFRYNSC
jgi:hypothetical protein